MAPAPRPNRLLARLLMAKQGDRHARTRGLAPAAPSPTVASRTTATSSSSTSDATALAARGSPQPMTPRLSSENESRCFSGTLFRRLQPGCVADRPAANGGIDAFCPFGVMHMVRQRLRQALPSAAICLFLCLFLNTVAHMWLQRLLFLCSLVLSGGESSSTVDWYSKTSRDLLWCVERMSAAVAISGHRTQGIQWNPGPLSLVTTREIPTAGACRTRRVVNARETRHNRF